MIDHGDRVLAASLGAMGGVSLRFFTPVGFNEFVIAVEEMGPLIELMTSVIAADAEKRLKAAETGPVTSLPDEVYGDDALLAAVKRA